MKRISTIVMLAMLCLPVLTLAGDYDKAWAALLKNEQQKAADLFRSAVKSNDNKDNAIAMLMALEAYRGGDYARKNASPLTQFTKADAYLYAFWFSDAIMGDYGKKKGKQLENLAAMANGEKYHGSIRAAANYAKAMHHLCAYRPDTAEYHFRNIGAIENWQFVGPFDNIAGSGFDKDYPPVSTPVSAEGFKSSNKNMVNWFTPLRSTNQGWVVLQPLFSQRSAIGYAQTFVNSPVEQDAVLALGGAGSFKAWVNDKLVIAEQDARRTELDAYPVKCHLRQGYNRILVQIGYTSEMSYPNFILRLTNDNFTALPNITVNPKPQPYKPDLSATPPVELTHFAEKYFLDRIAATPKDPANYLLLSKVYLRNQQYDKAKAQMNTWVRKYPENPFIINSYADCLSPDYEQTRIAEMVEAVKLPDPENYWVMTIEATKLEEEKKYDEALSIIETLEARNGRSLLLDLRRINLMAHTGKIDSTILMVKDVYTKEPDNAAIVSLMTNFSKYVTKDPEATIRILTTFLKDNYYHDLNKMVVEEYLERNDNESAKAEMLKIINMAPYDPKSYTALVQHFSPNNNTIPLSTTSILLRVSVLTTMDLSRTLPAVTYRRTIKRMRWHIIATH
ncbi:hypothetical protein MKQ70_09155 [Chitinophaga sedimenti]|uniref:tetratricopeptide repeat protein n=1 Tax=Chitinophaga sedimenti TaxID=2033606 RepID=UPI00200463E4|nr:hypothetical protein [Chitinophaga sedimenti]MCK7555164.1 hypothetical protein [Chitinophaga sedimenti]